MTAKMVLARRRRSKTSRAARKTARQIQTVKGGEPSSKAVDHDRRGLKQKPRGRQESMIHLHALVDNMRQGVLFEDDDRKIGFANSAFCALFGIPSPKAILGADCAAMAKQAKSAFADPEGFVRTIDQRLREKKFVLSEEMKLTDGRVFERDYIPIISGRDQIGNYWIYRDVSERRKIESTLRKSEEEYRTLVENIPDYVMRYDRRHRHIFANSRTFQANKVTADEFIGKTHREMGFDPQLCDIWEKAIDKVFETGRPQVEVFDWKDASGTTLRLEWRVYPEYAPDGEIETVLGISRDITERKQVEEQIRASENRFRGAFENISFGATLIDLKGRFIKVNQSMCSILDYSEEEMLSKSFSDITHPEDIHIGLEALKKLLSGKADHIAFEKRYIRKDGKVIHAMVSASLIYDGKGNPQYCVGLLQDITERRQVEQALLLQAAMLNATPGFVGFADAKDTHILYINPAGRKMVGIQAQEDVTRFKIADVHPEWTNKLMRDEILPTAVRDGVWTGECAFLNRDGREIPVMMVLLSHKSPDGDVERFSTVSIDISDRKQAEEKIRQNEAFIRNILDTVDEGFIVIDRDYRIVTANKAYCGQVDKTSNEVIGGHCYEISHRTKRPCYEESEECAVHKVFDTGAPNTVLHKHTDAGGHVHYMETKAYPVKDASGNVASVIETINNITEKHLLEEERLKTQKLESIGTLAGGIAHDFNNLLQGIFGYISMAKITLDQKEKSLAMLEQAEKALHQSVNLTTQLLTFSKGGKPVKKSLSLQSVIENAARFALSGSRSECRIKCDPDLKHVEADEGQLGQVIQNIVLNADQAMPLGGCVVITAQNVSASDTKLPQSISGKNHVLITIRDSGIGIPEQYINKIFDPYFTTKEKGSGLGLATSYSIIKNHNGLIEVKSDVGKGSTFLIYLPAIEPTPEQMRLETAPALAKSGRVLIMDDEKVIRDVAGELLRVLGHESALAESGEAVLTMYREAMTTANPFDVVILDMTIRGGKGGLETIGTLLEIDPGVRAIASSGYSDDAVLANYREQGFKAFLKKPYNIKELQNILSDLLK